MKKIYLRKFYSQERKVLNSPEVDRINAAAAESSKESNH